MTVKAMMMNMMKTRYNIPQYCVMVGGSTILSIAHT